MKRLLAFTALIEAAAGLALMAAPAVAVRLLLGGKISGASIPLGRVAGLSLLSLGIACWPGLRPYRQHGSCSPGNVDVQFSGDALSRLPRRSR